MSLWLLKKFWGILKTITVRIFNRNARIIYLNILWELHNKLFKEFLKKIPVEFLKEVPQVNAFIIKISENFWKYIWRDFRESLNSLCTYFNNFTSHYLCAIYFFWVYKARRLIPVSKFWRRRNVFPLLN